MSAAAPIPPAAGKGGLLETFLDGPMRGVEDIVFAARGVNPTDGHWYANFGYYAHDPDRKAWVEGTKLYRFHLRTRRLTALLDDPRGGVRDPQVSYDGRKVLFSYRPGGTEHYHLYEMELDPPGADPGPGGRTPPPRQITSGPFDDIEPAWLPDGGIVFVSSRLLKMLDGTHHGVQASARQKTLLRLWIETGAAYPGTYAALGCGMIGNYAENQQVNTGADWPATRAASQVLRERCVQCHEQPGRLLPLTLADERGVSFWQPSLDDPRLLTSRHLVFNLSRPEKSLVLLAPLAKEAGGWGLCASPRPPVPAAGGTGRKGSPGGSAAKAGTPNGAVFTSIRDPGYQAILGMITAGKNFLERDNPRFDMTHFKPRPDWFREMKRYGLVPQCVAPGEVSDVYAIEQDYWRSLWPQPARTAAVP